MVQYKIVTGQRLPSSGTPSLEQQLNDLAKDGWRAINLAITPNGAEYVLLEKQGGIS